MLGGSIAKGLLGGLISCKPVKAAVPLAGVASLAGTRGIEEAAASVARLAALAGDNGAEL